MAEENKNGGTIWLLIEDTVFTYNEDTYEIEQQIQNRTEEKHYTQKIKIITTQKPDKADKYAYVYTKDDGKKEIWVYDTDKNGDNKENPIPEKSWYIKLAIKGEESNKYLYITLIRTTTDMGGNNVNLDDIFTEINEIAKSLNINRITLQDDADFPCNKKNNYGLKAVYLRALNEKINIGDDWADASPDTSNLSIYQKHNFRPTKYTKTKIQGCIAAVRQITCGQLKTACNNLIKIITSINEKGSNYSIYKMSIKPIDDSKDPNQDLLPIEYKEMEEVSYPSICQNYIKNLNELLSILPKDSDDTQTLYNCYKSLCTSEENEECCNSRSNLLLSLKKSINSNVIVIKGIVNKGIVNDDGQKQDNCCEPKISDISPSGPPGPPLPTRGTTEPLPQTTSVSRQLRPTQSLPTPEIKPPRPIIVTKLFNLFYGTFEKLRFIYHEMEYKITP